MGTISIHVRLPLGAAEGLDRYRQVSIEPSGSPFRWTFYYMELHEDIGPVRLVCVGSSVMPPVDDPGVLDKRKDVGVLSASVFSEWKRLEALARAELARFLGGEESGALPFVAKLSRRRELSDSFIRAIADRYRAHREAGDPPTQSIMREEGVSRRTVGNWVAEARRKGFLESTTRGRSGG